MFLEWFDPPIYLNFNHPGFINKYKYIKIVTPCPEDAVSVKVDMAWVGLMGYFLDGKASPVWEETKKNVWVALNCFGFGVSFSAVAGKVLAEKMYPPMPKL
jgi:hypothetical protein